MKGMQEREREREWHRVTFDMHTNNTIILLLKCLRGVK